MSRYLQMLGIVVLFRIMSTLWSIPFIEANAIAYGLAVGLIVANFSWGVHNPTGLPFFNPIREDGEGEAE